ncbi:MAG: hypothetical protein ACT4OQ_12115, partial [Chloroflexota bacterium]
MDLLQPRIDRDFAGPVFFDADCLDVSVCLPGSAVHEGVLDVVEKSIDLACIEVLCPAVPEVDRGVDESGPAPALARPRRSVQLGSKNSFISVAPSSTRVEDGVESRPFVLAVPSHRLNHGIQQSWPW